VVVMRIGTEIQVDPALLAGVDALAASEGRSRDDVIEDAVRRTVASHSLKGILVRSRSASTLSAAQADELVSEERRSARSEGRGTSAAG
jgi:metal-responsive CopG/Arc/MetJ family transcriptional regulator